MSAALALLGGATALVWGGADTVRILREYLSGALQLRSAALVSAEMTPAVASALLRGAASVVVRACLPVVAAAALMGLAADLGQVGLNLTAHPLTPKLDRLDPLAGVRRMVSKRALFELAKSLAKVTVVALAAYSAVAPQLKHFGGMSLIHIEQGMALAGALAWQVASRTLGALLLVAVIDYGYQRWEHEQSLRMTREEVKQELKETDGDPKLRSRIRQRQREISRRRMMAAVPKADVVIANPTHFACALAYRGGEMRAPRLVAKGQDHMALRIREVAREHKVPVVTDAPLARALYASVEIGAEVPPELYRAVAEALAFVYRLEGKVA
jgi:flagellar biosynthetic protein FlhB